MGIDSFASLSFGNVIPHHPQFKSTPSTRHELSLGQVNQVLTTLIEHDRTLTYCVGAMALRVLHPGRSTTNRFTKLKQVIFQRRCYAFSSYLVTPAELQEALSKNAPTKISTDARVIPIAAPWYMPNDPKGRTGPDAFKKKRIPSARFFNLDEIKDQDSPYPHMLPTCETFAEAMAKMGIRKEDELVVYDTEDLGLFSAPRVAWTMRVYGYCSIREYAKDMKLTECLQTSSRSCTR